MSWLGPYTAHIGHRLLRNAAVALTLSMTAGCGQVVSIWGDSQSYNASKNIAASYSNPLSVDVHGRVGCGLYADPLCPTPDWGSVIKATRTNYTTTGQTVACFVVHLGLNDALWQTDLATRNYALVLDRFLKQFPSTDKIVWLNLPFAQAPTLPGLDTRLQFVNAQLASAATRFPNLTVWDLRTHFNGQFPAWYAVDGFHYNQTGLIEYAAQMRAATDSVGCS